VSGRPECRFCGGRGQMVVDCNDGKLRAVRCVCCGCRSCEAQRQTIAALRESTANAGRDAANMQRVIEAVRAELLELDLDPFGEISKALTQYDKERATT